MGAGSSKKKKNEENKIVRASVQTISNAKPGRVPSLYDPRKGGSPSGQPQYKVGVRLEDPSEYDHSAEEGEEEENEEDQQSPQKAEEAKQVELPTTAQVLGSQVEAAVREEPVLKINRSGEFLGTNSNENSLDEDRPPRQQQTQVLLSNRLEELEKLKQSVQEDRVENPIQMHEQVPQPVYIQPEVKTIPLAQDVDENPDYYNFDLDAKKEQEEALQKVQTAQYITATTKPAEIQEFQASLKMSRDQLIVAKARFQDLEEKDRLNPNNILIRVLLINLAPFYPPQVLEVVKSSDEFTRAETEEWNDRHRLFALFVAKTSSIYDLKTRLEEEMGLPFEETQVYFANKVLDQTVYLTEIPEADVTQDSILTVICTGRPAGPFSQTVRDTLNEVKIADVRYFNTSSKLKPWTDWEFDASFNLDETKVPWPIYRDWTQEAASLSKTIVRCKSHIIEDERSLDQMGGRTVNKDRMEFNYSPVFQELVNAERLFEKLNSDFKKASVYAVHAINKRNPTPLNLHNLLGDGGDKYVVGGLFVRRAQGWTVSGQQFQRFEMLESIDTIGQHVNSDLSEISAKLAALEVRNAALLRNKFENLIVPLMCTVDYFGQRFLVSSLIPASINSLAYGSNTDGLVFENRDVDAEQMAVQISAALNLRPHVIRERATHGLKQIYLPYSVQLHRNVESQLDRQFYLASALRLFPLEESLRSSTRVLPPQEFMAKQLRPELVFGHNHGEIQSQLQYYTWKNPVRCDECGEIIYTHTYFYYEKPPIGNNKQPSLKYYCCHECFDKLAPIDGFKHPMNKIIQRELPEAEKEIYWLDSKTKQRFHQVQYQKVSLNPDAFIKQITAEDLPSFPTQNGLENRTEDQEEVYRASLRLTEEIIPALVKDLNEIEEDPLSAKDLATLMHSRGLTMRHLGKVCSEAALNHTRELLVIEVIARCAKLLIRDGLAVLAETRATVDQPENDQEEIKEVASNQFTANNIKRCTLHYIHQIFDVQNVTSGAAATSIWDFLTEHARRKFFLTVEREILTKVHLNGLLSNILAKMNIRLTKPVAEINFAANKGKFLSIEDIEYIGPTVKDYSDLSLPMIATEDATPFSLNFVLSLARARDSEGRTSKWYMRGGPERQIASQIYSLGQQVAERVFTTRSMQFVETLKEAGLQLESVHMEKGSVNNSRWNKCAAIPEDDYSVQARYKLTQVLEILTEMKLRKSMVAAEVLMSLARLTKLTRDKVMGLQDEKAVLDTQFTYLAEMVSIHELNLGFDHPETADSYSKIALAYQEAGRYQASAPWMRRAFCTFYKSFGPQDDLTLSSYQQLMAIETSIDSDLHRVPYDQLPQIIYQLESQQQAEAPTNAIVAQNVSTGAQFAIQARPTQDNSFGAGLHPAFVNH